MIARFRYPILLVAALIGAWWFYQSRQPKYGSGELAPDIVFMNTDGGSTRLSDLKGKVILLQFWGSWCGPCRAENPHLVSLYRKYHQQGFEIASVGIEKSAERWKKAIAQDGMIWPYHASSLQNFDDPAAVLYNIKQIPSTFVIDAKGQIAGVNLGPDMIDKLVGQLLSK